MNQAQILHLFLTNETNPSERKCSQLSGARPLLDFYTLHATHWRQTQPLLQIKRAEVWWLSLSLSPHRVESPGQSKLGAIADKTSLAQLFVQHKCTVMDEFNGNNLQLQ